ncbi:DMT family transporter [Leptospira sp. FAT2]|uniref:DMT family transporter n=1 Tax=Leptospira sanjuanensis TaxID=2879643 RepID=UPI001EE8E9B4|nr:DMT family transporter [Leptospira sanjuanensis]MCG6167746.1 DMT family transporter [Leptospira sanjuanensis]MCG6193163.1 DMT family transporter [Leptospira sanjuanensis]
MSSDSKTKIFLEFQFAMILISGNILFAKLIDESVWMITFGRTVFASAGLYLFLKWRDKPLFFPSAIENKAALGGGILLAIHWVLFFASARLASPAIAVLTLFTHPVITVFIEPLYYPVKPKGRDVLLALLVLLGVGILIPELKSGNDLHWGIIAGLISALSFSFRNLLTKKFLSHHGSAQVMCLQSFAAVFVLAPVCYFETIPTSLRSLGLIFLLGSFFTAFAHTLYVKSMFQLKLKTAGILSSIQPVYSILLAWLLLGDIPGYREMIGGALILVAGTLETIRFGKEE